MISLKEFFCLAEADDGLGYKGSGGLKSLENVKDILEKQKQALDAKGLQIKEVLNQGSDLSFDFELEDQKKMLRFFISDAQFKLLTDFSKSGKKFKHFPEVYETFYIPGPSGNKADKKGVAVVEYVKAFPKGSTENVTIQSCLKLMGHYQTEFDNEFMDDVKSWEDMKSADHFDYEGKDKAKIKKSIDYLEHIGVSEIFDEMFKNGLKPIRVKGSDFGKKRDGTLVLLNIPDKQHR